MKILAIDTTAKTATVAIAEDETLVAEYSLTTDTHSTVLLPMIESVMKHHNVTVDDIDLFAVSEGPGSFTGVRIGVSTIKGLAFKNNTNCVGVSSLEAMAMNFKGIEAIVVPVIDARRDTFYTAVFDCDVLGNVKRITEDSQLSADEILQLISSQEKNVYFTGDAYSKIKSLPEFYFTPSTPERLRRQSAYGVSCAALKKWNETNDKSVFSDTNLLPTYLKKSQAEREREEKISTDGGNT